jgi:competence protein ComEA
LFQYREAHGRFSSGEEIMNVDGIKEGVFNKIKDSIKV